MTWMGWEPQSRHPSCIETVPDGSCHPVIKVRWDHVRIGMDRCIPIPGTLRIGMDPSFRFLRIGMDDLIPIPIVIVKKKNRSHKVFVEIMKASSWTTSKAMYVEHVRGVGCCQKNYLKNECQILTPNFETSFKKKCPQLTKNFFWTSHCQHQILYP